MCIFTLEYTHFIFNRCPIYIQDGASAKLAIIEETKQITVYIIHKDDFAFCSCSHSLSVLLPEEYQYHKEKKRGGQNNLCAEIE